MVHHHIELIDLHVNLKLGDIKRILTLKKFILKTIVEC